MENELKALKSTHKENTPKFTNNDRIKIRQTIKNPGYKRKRYFIPEVLTVALFGTFLFFGGNWLMNSFFDSGPEGASNGSGSSSSSVSQPIYGNEYEEDFSDIDYVTYNSQFIQLENSDLWDYHYFDPNSIEMGDKLRHPTGLWNYEVTNINNEATGIEVTFSGTAYDSGTIYVQGEDLWYVPLLGYTIQYPITENVFDQPVSLRFQKNAEIFDILGITPSETTKASMIDVHLRIEETIYNYNEDYSVIYFDGEYLIDPYSNPNIYVQHEPSNSYEETIALSDELAAIYEKYANSRDDILLTGLSPFDVYRLYVHSINLENESVRQSLHINKESNSLADDWKSYMKPLMNDLEEVGQFNEYIVKEKVILSFITATPYTQPKTAEEYMSQFSHNNFRYEDNGLNGNYFHLRWEPNLKVWKVAFMDEIN